MHLFATRHRAPTVIYPSLIVADGATGYWQYGDASGSPAATVGNNSTLYPAGNGGGGAATVVYGYAGHGRDGRKGINFATDGNNYVYIYGNVLPTHPDNFTYECWYKSTATVPQGSIFGFEYLPNNPGQTNYDRELYINTGGFPVFRTYGPSPALLIGTSSVADGNWHHIVVTFKGDSTSTSYMYVDGVQQSSLVMAPGSNFGAGSGYLAITGAAMNSNFTGGSYLPNFVGGLQDIAFYDGINLTPAQVLAHYNAGI